MKEASIYNSFVLWHFGFEVIQVIFRSGDLQRQFPRCHWSNLVDRLNVLCGNGAVDCSGFDELMFFHIDKGASGWRNNLAKDCFLHVVVCFGPCRFGRERFEMSDELVCASHRLFKFLVLFSFEVIQSLGSIVYLEYKVCLRSPWGICPLCPLARSLWQCFLEDDAQDCLVIILVEVFSSAKIKDFSPYQFKCSGGVDGRVIIWCDHSHHIFLVQKVCFPPNFQHFKWSCEFGG